MSLSKMEIQSAHDREDSMKGIRDFDDIMSLINAGDNVQYTPKEREKYKRAFGEFVETYIEQNPKWTLAQWKKNTNLE